MTQKIRKSVFETNSSSSHSLTVAKGDVHQTPFSKAQLRAGVVTIGLGDYNWEWYRYYSPVNKLQYLLTQALLGSGSYGGAAIPEGDAVEVTRELCEDNARVARLCEVVKAHTGCTLLVQPGSTGGIDHESVGNGMELFSSAEELSQFIFSAESYIETGNDNSGPSKLISSDRGSEHYYGAHYREAAADWVPLKVTNEGGLWHETLTSPQGIELSQESNQELFQAILAQGTVVKASWKTVGPWAHFEHESPIGRAMSDLAGFGLKFSATLVVSEDFTKQDFNSKKPRTSVATLELRIPVALVQAVEALEAQQPVKTAKSRKKPATKKEA